jgi:glucosyl-dolichyl phosphate glucuronosyltransferase
VPVPAPATSVVVASYDNKRWDDLVACLASLAAQTTPPLETIVVIDHNPALLEKARGAFPQARVIPNERPRGLAGARNSGIAVAEGEVVAFIDDDARAAPQWLEKLAGCIAEPTTVGAGGALLPLWQASVPRWLPREFYWVFGCSYTGLPEELAPVRNPIGANMAVRASVLAEIGGFREGEEGEAPRELRARGVVRAGGNVPDDTDLAIRVKQRQPDAVWLYEPAAEVLHSVTHERTRLSYFLRRCYEEGAGKANLARYVGADEGLSSERRHLMVALPRGVAAGFGDLLRGDPRGALRAGAIVVGLAASACGFLVANLQWRVAAGRRRKGNGEIAAE